ncbi:MAG: hypothetical protein WBL23_08920 [Salinisphaera sp.]|uniref:F0F1 ATP synthase subunit B family protein n=1 Tax=Salinisphaera sp. TaxID=1914330 RepID=UPI003C7ACFAE
MLIDWFTVGAQLVNFLVLVWLLKRFLYQPILKAIDARETLIAAELADASRKQATADAAREDFLARNAQFDADRDALMAKAADDAAEEEARLLADARAAGDALRARQRAALQTERANLSEAIARLTGSEVLAAARKTLADLADAELEARMAAVFVRRLQEMDPVAQAALADVLRSAIEPACLRSTFELDGPAKAAIQRALDTVVGGPVSIAFQTAPDELCGIELTAGGHKLAWRIEDYLAALGDKLDKLLAAQIASAGPSDTEPAADPAAQTAPAAAPVKSS